MVTDPQNVIAIVPMKPLSQGKSRLAQSLTADQRADLALGMLRRVVLAIKAASIDTVWVVGGDDRVCGMIRILGAECLEELGEDLNDTLKKAFELAFEQGQSARYVAGGLRLNRVILPQIHVLCARLVRNLNQFPFYRSVVGVVNGPDSLLCASEPVDENSREFGCNERLYVVRSECVGVFVQYAE